MIRVEDIKGLNMVRLLSDHYGMSFRHVGGEHVSLSPFTKEEKPSFFVRQAEDGHWLFKDFSSGYGGSIIDFVLLKEEFSNISDGLAHIHRLLGDKGSGLNQTPYGHPICSESPQREYEIKEIYRKLRTNDLDICCKYLTKRGISDEVIDDLCEEGILFHNHHQGHSYCCFAVFDRTGELKCLDNHQIDGERKFILGKKDIFTRDWENLPGAEVVFVCEGVIDYLSMKTLEGMSLPGIALLGNMVRFDTELFKSARVVMSALDGDAGGVSAYLDLQEKFPDKEFSVYDFGTCNDPNEYLKAVKEGKDVTNLTAQDKLSLYKEFMSAENKSEVALKWGINRSYMYQIVKECEEMILGGFSDRHPGRKSGYAPATLDEAIKRIAILEEEKRHEAKEKERFYARSEFMKLRLKWAESEARELRGEPIANDHVKQKKNHVKKKKGKRR